VVRRASNSDDRTVALVLFRRPCILKPLASNIHLMGFERDNHFIIIGYQKMSKLNFTYCTFSISMVDSDVKTKPIKSLVSALLLLS
jgi:hypothetical protein